MQVAFYQSESEQPHPGRARAIIKAHPEVRELMVRNPWTALIAVSIVLMQTAIALGMGQDSCGALFEFHSATGNARATSQKTARDHKYGVPGPNPRLARTALSRRCRPNAQVVASVNDQHTHGNKIQSIH